MNLSTSDPKRQFEWLQTEILSALRQLEERLSPAELKFLDQQLSSSLKDTGKQFVRVSDTLGKYATLFTVYDVGYSVLKMM
jgi:hypothetical protein